MDDTATAAVDQSLVSEDRPLEQELAEQLVERARLEGVLLTGPDGLLTGLTRRVLETALEVELTEHLGHEPGGRVVSGNVRNGRTPKTVQTDVGPVRLTVPRDRQATFEPQVVPQHARRLEGFNEAIVSLYARGLTTGDIQAHLRQLYGAEVSRELISKVTDTVVDELIEWQNRPLDRGLPGGVDRLHRGQDPGRGGPEPAHLRGHGHQRRRRARRARPVGGPGRRGGSQAVAGHADRAA